MDKNNIWQVLGIEETKNQEAIRAAYRNQLVHTNPEDDAAGFMALRSAYEAAIAYCSQPEDAAVLPQAEKTDIDLWIDALEDIYMHIRKRVDKEAWSELLQNSVCVGLDTFLEARERLLAYLMDHSYLTKEVWQLLDQHFYFVKDKEALFQIFPKRFIEYVVDQVQNHYLINLELFTAPANTNVDDYIRSYYSIKGMIDNRNLAEIDAAFAEIDTDNIYNPYVDVERGRYYIERLRNANNPDGKDEASGDTADKELKLSDLNDDASFSALKAQNEQHTQALKTLIAKLTPYLDDDYIAYYVAKMHWAVGQQDEAAALWQKLYDKIPTHYGAGIGLIEYAMFQGKYKESNDRIMTLSRTYSQDEQIYNLLTETNNHLIEEYRAILKNDPQNLEIKQELAWCYYQNGLSEECIALLAEFPQDEKSAPWFLKLQSYVQGKKGDYQAALTYNFRWLEAIKKDPEAENYQRDLAICNQLIALCYMNLEDYEKSVPYFKNAISEERNLSEKLYTMERLSYALLKAGNNEDCIEVCDEIIELSPGYYPAYINRQEAYFNMQNAQKVIDDYHNATEIYPHHVKPYLLAQKVYYFYRQYDDSISVYKQAKEMNLSSPELELYYGKNLRLNTQSEEESEAALDFLLDLRENMQAAKEEHGSFTDEEESVYSEVLHEIARACADVGKFEEGIAVINDALALYPNDHELLSTKAYLHMDLENYAEAVKILESIIDQYPDHEYKHRSLAKAYENIGKKDEAVLYYQKTLEINPENVEVLERLGDIYMDRYKAEENMAHYHQAIILGEKILALMSSCYYYVHVGIMYERGYEFEKSLECYRKAAEIDPDDIWPHNNSGYTYKLMGRYEEAIEKYKQAIAMMTVGQSMMPYRNLATVYEILEQYDKAMECYEEVLKHWPDHISTHERIADLLGDMGKLAEAEQKYLWLLEKYDYTEEEAYRNLMNLYLLKPHMDKASYYAQRLLDVTDEPANLRKVGSFYYSIGALKKAEALLTRVVKNTQNKETYHYLLSCLDLAKVYAEKGNDKRAKAFAEEALLTVRRVYTSEEIYASYKPSLPINNYQLGNIFLLLGDFEKAEKHFSACISSDECSHCKSTNCFEGYFGLGKLHEAKGNLDRAEEYYQKTVALDDSYLFVRYLEALQNKKNPTAAKSNPGIEKGSFIKKLFGKF